MSQFFKSYCIILRTVFLIGCILSISQFLYCQNNFSTSNTENLDSSYIKSDQILESILRAAPSGIGVVKNRVFVSVNDYILDLTGYSRDELIGKSARMLYPSSTEYEYVGTEKYRQIHEKGTGTVETVWKKKDGKLINIILSSTPYNLEKLEEGVVFTVTDITERTKTEEILAKRKRNFLFFSFMLVLLLLIILIALHRNLQKRKKVEKKLLEKTNELEGYFSSTLDLLCIADLHGNFIRVNKEWENVLGYTVKDLENKSFFDFVHPDDIADTHKTMKKLSEQKDVLNFINRYKSKQGEYRFIEWKSTTENGLIYAAARDITERIETENQLLESKKILRDVIDTIPVRVFWKDRESKYLGCNILFAQDADKNNPEEIIGKTDEDLKWHNLAKEYRDDDLEVMEHDIPKYNYEEKFTTNTGQTLILRTSKIPLKDAHGAIYGILGVYDDITEQKQAEQDLIFAKEKAEESERLKSAFLANMSHEIRTPLNAILGFSSFLLEDDITKDLYRKYAEIISNSGNHLLHIINDIIDISRIDSGQMNIVIEPVNIHVLLPELADITRSNLKKKPHVQVICKNYDSDLYVETDETRLRQILINLLGNATKFTHTGSIEFGYSIQESFLEFYVKDTGIGIPAEKQNVIFERFMQAAETTEKFYGGTGLGLPIAKACTELLGGTMWVESEETKGTCFYFTIPYIPHISKNSENKKSNTVSIQYNKELLLVAEDEDFNYEYI